MISLLFRLINLVIIAGAGIYLMRRFGLPLLKQGLSQHEQEKNMLEYEQTTLKKLHVQLDHELTAQDKLCAELSEKVDQWYQLVLIEQEEAQQEQLRVITVLKKRYNQQQENYNLLYTVRQVAPIVQQQLTKELSEYYAHTDEAQEYISAVVEHLRKNT